MRVKKIDLDLPLLDSLSNNAQKVYLFLCSAQGKHVSVKAMSNILHLPEKTIPDGLLELLIKKYPSKTRLNTTRTRERVFYDKL